MRVKETVWEKFEEFFRGKVDEFWFMDFVILFYLKFFLFILFWNNVLDSGGVE